MSGTYLIGQHRLRAANSGADLQGVARGAVLQPRVGFIESGRGRRAIVGSDAPARVTGRDHPIFAAIGAAVGRRRAAHRLSNLQVAAHSAVLQPRVGAVEVGQARSAIIVGNRPARVSRYDRLLIVARRAQQLDCRIENLRFDAAHVDAALNVHVAVHSPRRSP